LIITKKKKKTITQDKDNYGSIYNDNESM
jgi:hypothetical protein